MAVRSDCEHFIPMRKSWLRERLCADSTLSSQEQGQFRQWCQLLAATFHFEFHARLEQLKDAYAPFDPDSETASATGYDHARESQGLSELFDEFIALLERANFRRLTREEIGQALDVASDWGINLSVNFDVFERMELFARGDSVGRRSRRNWRNWFRMEEVDVPVFRRLVLILRLRDHPALPRKLDTQSVFIKIFKDIPKQDLEMLLPGTSVRMTLADRGKIVLPALSGLAITIWKVIKGALVLAAAGIYGTLAFLGLVGGTIGYGVRSFVGYLQTKQKYQLNLTQSLYYQNLDNNSGALCRLLDEAEEQECREAMLAYFYLWRYGGENGWTESELDDAIERRLEQTGSGRVDFEVSDALQKLLRLGLVHQSASGRWRAIPIATALEVLDRAWDSFFRFNAAESVDRTAVPHSATLAGNESWNRDKRSESCSQRSA